MSNNEVVTSIFDIQNSLFDIIKNSIVCPIFCLFPQLERIQRFIAH